VRTVTLREQAQAWFAALSRVTEPPACNPEHDGKQRHKKREVE
jgi:hypothetical protein